MIETIFLYAPCLMAMTAICVSLLRHRAKTIDWWMIGQLVLLVIYCFADAWSFLPDPNPRWSAVIDIMSKVSVLSMVPTIIFWYHKKSGDKEASRWYYLIYILPLVMLVALIVLYYIIGNSEVYNPATYFYWRDPSGLLKGSQAYMQLYWIGVTWFTYFVIAEMAAFVCHFSVELYRLLRSRPLSLHKKYMMQLVFVFFSIVAVVLIRIAFGYDYLRSHDVVSAMFFIAFSVMILAVMYIDISDSLVDENKHLTDHAVIRLLNQAPSIDKVRFERLMLTNRWCYKKGVTEEAVAKELGTTRSYLAYMLKTYYGQTFPNWVMEKRIRYAQELMLENPDARQAEIAEKCGFADGSVFSRSFSKVTNMTPRGWYLMNKK